MHSAFLCQWRGRAYLAFIADIHVVMLRIYRVLLSIRIHRSSCSLRLCSLSLYPSHGSLISFSGSSAFPRSKASSSFLINDTTRVIYSSRSHLHTLYRTSYVRACNVQAHVFFTLRRMYHYDSSPLAHRHFRVFLLINKAKDGKGRGKKNSRLCEIGARRDK